MRNELFVLVYKLLKSISKVLTPILRIYRGGHEEVKIQFTIPFVNLHLNWSTGEHQGELNINMGVHNRSVVGCDDPNSNVCEKKCMLIKGRIRISTTLMTGKLNTISQSTIKTMAVTPLTSTSHSVLRQGPHPVSEAKFLIKLLYQIFR